MLAEAPRVLLLWPWPTGHFSRCRPSVTLPSLFPPSNSSPLSHSCPPMRILGYSDPAFCLPSPRGVPHPNPRAAGSQTVQHQEHLPVARSQHTHTHTPQPSYSDNLLFHILYSRAIASREKHESSKVTMTIRGRNHERRLTYPSLL